MSKDAFDLVFFFFFFLLKVQSLMSEKYIKVLGQKILTISLYFQTAAAQRTKTSQSYHIKKVSKIKSNQMTMEKREALFSEICFCYRFAEFVCLA